jgi:hypothetical protein
MARSPTQLFPPALPTSAAAWSLPHRTEIGQRSLDFERLAPTPLKAVNFLGQQEEVRRAEPKYTHSPQNCSILDSIRPTPGSGVASTRGPASSLRCPKAREKFVPRAQGWPCRAITETTRDPGSRARNFSVGPTGISAPFQGNPAHTASSTPYSVPVATRRCHIFTSA